MESINFLRGNFIVEKSDISLAKKGSSEAFTKLMQDNLDSMYRVSKGILTNEVDVEDAIQNTIYKAYKNIKSLKKDKYFKTWLIRILINESNKIYSKSKRIYSKAEEETYTIDKGGHIDLYNAISNLPEEFKVTTILFYFDDMSHKEIAKTLDIAEGTVKSRLSRAKERLYVMLKEK
ncbi:RNA polymerase sigma factor [Clostridium sardiniense]|nr:sigma-70 family RNA polymerase sigma factor [Clostridium sardiniense]MDQ0459457.1 RNA polymerase sigma-70 factor (ECF subfamily) [Clostridium sardiniense]